MRFVVKNTPRKPILLSCARAGTQCHASDLHVYSALEPVISAEIMELHHAKHHQAYVNGFNAAYEKYKEVQPAVHDALVCTMQLHACGAGFICMHLT